MLAPPVFYEKPSSLRGRAGPGRHEPTVQESKGRMTSTLQPVCFEVFPLKKQTARGVFKTATSALSTETDLELEVAKVQTVAGPSPPIQAMMSEKGSITHLSPSAVPATTVFSKAASPSRSTFGLFHNGPEVTWEMQSE